jgi:sugar lactone lactonase YvrE
LLTPTFFPLSPLSPVPLCIYAAWAQEELAKEYEVRLNDGRVDAAGRLLVGGLNFKNYGTDEWEHCCPIYVVESVQKAEEMEKAEGAEEAEGSRAEGSGGEGSQTGPTKGVGGTAGTVSQVSTRILEHIPTSAISNSICFNAQGDTVYHCDTPTKQIVAYKYDCLEGVVTGTQGSICTRYYPIYITHTYTYTSDTI